MLARTPQVARHSMIREEAMEGPKMHSAALYQLPQWGVFVLLVIVLVVLYVKSQRGS